MKRKKIYYTGGLISLLVLPVFILLFLNKRDISPKQYVLQVVWGHSGFIEQTEVKANLFRTLHSKKYTDIRFDDKKTDNVVRLNFARLEIRALMAAGDSVRGIHFHLSDDTPYETLVRVIEMFTVENVRTYYANKNDIWVFNYAPTAELHPIPQFICGNTSVSAQNIMHNDFDFFKEIPLRFLVPLALFVLLIWLNWNKRVLR